MRWIGGAGGNGHGKTLGLCVEGGDGAWEFPRIPLGKCGALEFGERKSESAYPWVKQPLTPIPPTLVSLAGPPPSPWCLSSPS